MVFDQASIAPRLRHVRFTPESGHVQCNSVRFVPIADIVPQKETALRRSLQIQFARYSHAMFFNRDACCASTRARAFFPSLAASVMVS
jgi:hypothetical protein